MDVSLLPHETEQLNLAGLEPFENNALNDPIRNSNPNSQMTGGAVSGEVEPESLMPGQDGSPLDPGADPVEANVVMDDIILGNNPIRMEIDSGNPTADPMTGEPGESNGNSTDNDSISDPSFLLANTQLNLDLNIADPVNSDPNLTLAAISFPASDQVWSQNTPGVLGVSEAFDSFGEVLATGDFNNDGYTDLAVGSPDEDIETGLSTISGAGAVNVIYGTASGLSATSDQIWHQDTTGVLGVAEAFDGFGSSLAAGDFNNDGFDDLAIGVPGEDLGQDTNNGAVNVLYGGTGGLTATNDQFWDQDDLIGSSTEDGDRFGASLTSGDFDGDGFDDLAVGAPDEDLGTGISAINSAGAVNVIYGSNIGNGTTHGLNAAGNQFWSQNSFGIEDVAEAFDNFGFSLSAGDYNNDGRDDLAIGVPFEDLGTGTSAINSAGAVNVIQGGFTGLTSTNDQFWHQDSFGVLGIAEDFDDFGWSLTSGDYNNDGRDDLAIGVPFEDIGSITNAGAVNVLYGGGSLLSDLNDQFWHQNSTGIQGVAQAFDNFGRSLTSGDFDNDGFDDLGVGVPFEDVGNISNAGAANIIRGSASRLTHLNDRLVSQNTLDLTDEVAENFDDFASSLAAGDFNGDGFADLAAGVPGEDIGTPTITNAGVVNVIYDV